MNQRRRHDVEDRSSAVRREDINVEPLRHGGEGPLRHGQDFDDGSVIASGQRDAWREAQLEIYNHSVLICDGRAATTLEAVDTTQDAVGWNTHILLQDKYGDAKRAQLSKLVRKYC